MALSATGAAVVASADRLATDAGIAVLALGGNAVDAAIATNAALAVVGPHFCGLGGDLLALVWDGSTAHALNASGRAPAAASAAELRAEGRQQMPVRGDVRAVTVPGCADGWLLLHERFGNAPLADVLAPAVALAEGGFPASPLLARSAGLLNELGRAELHEIASQANVAGSVVRRPGVARALNDIVDGGRGGFYGGEFGAGLVRRWPEWFAADDLATSQAEWVTPIRRAVWGVDLLTMPPNSQGYLLLGSAAIAASAELPERPNDPQWAHVLIEAAAAAGHDRPARLWEHADGAALVSEIATRTIDPRRAAGRAVPHSAGDTTYLCTTDAGGRGVSLIQSNAAGFGSWLAEPSTGINLHNRGLGFSLVPDHPAELAPGRRPPHTLCPVLATAGGALEAVFGTMGGDAQPQILLQLAARLFRHKAPPRTAVEAPRWALRGTSSGFDTWTHPGRPIVAIEGGAAERWLAELIERGHEVRPTPPLDSSFGHAQAIVRRADGRWDGAADPRSLVGSCAAFGQ